MKQNVESKVESEQDLGVCLHWPWTSLVFWLMMKRGTILGSTCMEEREHTLGSRDGTADVPTIGEVLESLLRL